MIGWLVELFTKQDKKAEIKRKKDIFFCAFKGMGTCRWEPEMQEYFKELPEVWADNPMISKLWIDMIAKRVKDCTQFFHHGNPFLVKIEGEDSKALFKTLMMEMKNESKQSDI